jgi:hypothetical protein
MLPSSRAVGESAFLRSTVRLALLCFSEQRRVCYLPKGCNCNVDAGMAKCSSQMLHTPFLRCFPVCGSASDNEGTIPCDISHELERTRLLVKLFDDAAVEVVVGGEKILDGIISPHIGHVMM